ncbi:hypothetical protein [Halorussus sp. MSC15.2]|uniref:hypothetical protein n=1 Tax=Halorussus sp. MSC15.2 TaxID=2283638 RepID=UPI0013D01610|nr:hypothetical protein [Halorussus sp. MSC15.2]NEU59223.1 hypothetical protein [Halorussus sp. MSC15.2]
MNSSDITNRLKDAVWDRVTGESFETTVVDADLANTIQARQPDIPLTKIAPRPENDGIDAARDLVNTLYTVRTGQFDYQNQSPVQSFEVWYDESKVKFLFKPADEVLRERFEKQVLDKHPGSKIEEYHTRFPEVEEGDFISGATMDLRKMFYYPIKTPVEGVETFEEDPYGPLTSEMVVQEERTSDGQQVASDDCRMLVQVVFKPAKRTWSQKLPFGIDVEDRGMELKNGRLKDSLGRQLSGEVEVQDASRKMKNAGEQIAKQRGQPGFYTRIRVLAISPYREVAERHARGVAEVFETYYNAVTEQGLVSQPLPKDELRATVEKAASRTLALGLREKFATSEKTILTPPELAGIAHIPNDDIETPNVDWTYTESSPGVPADAPQFDDQTTTE